MKLGVFLISFLMLLTAVNAVGVDYTYDFCANSTTHVVHAFNNNGTANITTSYVYENCEYACDVNGTETCITPQYDLDYGLIIAIVLCVAVAVCLIVSAQFSAEQSAFKFFFLMLALFLTYFAVSNVGAIGVKYTAGFLPSTGESIMNVGYAFFMAIVLVFLYFLLMMFVNAYRSFTGQDNG